MVDIFIADKFSGGMPSPARRIPLTVVASDWFIPIQGEEGVAYLPPSINEGSSITVEGSIKVLIRKRTESEMPPTNAQFKRTDTLVINANMPWLNRIIPKFKFSHPVTIEYPCELRNFNNLATVALGSRNKIKFDVSIHCFQDTVASRNLRILTLLHFHFVLVRSQQLLTSEILFADFTLTIRAIKVSIIIFNLLTS